MKKDKSKTYNHKKIENYWRKKWKSEGVCEPDINKPGDKFYNLWMFPYPSAEGLHAGHAFASTGSDVIGRYKRMNKNNVFQPIGYDSFGMHSENFALKIKEHPSNVIARTTENYERQMRMLGHGYDWERTVTTSSVEYYKWTQWLFQELFKAGLAYKKSASVNWCPSCKTVLADEQVMTPAQAGKEPRDKSGESVKATEGLMVCERCGTVVEKKDLEQWFFRITDYANKLLDNLNKIDWPEKIKIAQTNWIGKKEGINIEYPIKDHKKTIKVWTSRPDTNFGATFIVASPEYAKEYLIKIIEKDREDEINEYINISLNKSKDDRIAEGREKTGVFTGLYAINQLNGYEMPIWITDFVLADVGTGCVVGVPGHDKRDFEFAEKFGLEVIRVVVASDGDKSDIKKVEQVQEDEGVMVNSQFLDGLDIHKATQKIMNYLEEKGWGERTTNYHLRDWLVSRQRYWGAPIPMIYCDKCAKKGKSWFNTSEGKLVEPHKQVRASHSAKSERGDETDLESLSDLSKGKMLHTDQSGWNSAGWYPEENLPVELPDIKDFKPKGEGRGPLANHPEFYVTKCPACGAKAKRETDVLDTFVDSSWYFIRYPSVGLESSETEPFDKKITKNWLPVDLYFGGAEHSVLHLMYSRFVTMVLNDLGFIDFDEPFPWFYAHGLMIKDGAKMSKSRGNVVNPDIYIEKYGADTLRLYLMFMGPMDGYPDFRDTGIEGMRRFIDRVWDVFQLSNFPASPAGSNYPISSEEKIRIKMHQTIKKVSEDIQNFKYNTAIAAIMEYVNELRSVNQKSKIKNQKEENLNKIKTSKVCKKALKTLALLLAPFAPHITEEIWVNSLGQKFSIHKTEWPKYDPKLVEEEKVTIAVQINGKLRATLELDAEDSKNKDFVSKKAKENEKVQKWLEGKDVKKEIFVPGRVLNIVI